MVTNYPINPRVRAYGKARIDIAQRVMNGEDWDKLWVQPLNSFPFTWDGPWKHCIEYNVDDFAAEVGFFIDVMGFPIYALDSNYAMFTSPQADFFFAIIPAQEPGISTPPDALRLQFMVTDILSTTRELEKRGIAFDQPPLPLQPGSPLTIGSFRTPHGINIDLWGTVVSSTESSNKMDLLEQDKDEDDLADDEDDEIPGEDGDLDEEDEFISEDDEDDELVFDEGEDADEGDEEEDLFEHDEEDEDDEDDLTFDNDEDGDKDEDEMSQETAPQYRIVSPPTLYSLDSKSLEGLGNKQNTHQPEHIDIDLL